MDLSTDTFCLRFKLILSSDRSTASVQGADVSINRVTIVIRQQHNHKLGAEANSRSKLAPNPEE